MGRAAVAIAESDFQVLERNFGKAGASTLMGDIDGDGKVDNTDLKMFFANNGKYGSLAQGDFNGDGKVDFGDFQYLELNYGKTAAAFAPFDLPAGADALAVNSVPEPAAGLVGATGIALLAMRRRRVS